MSPAALVLWATLVALIVVLALAGLQVASALREIGRIATRVEEYADLPVVAALERAERDVGRIDSALAQLAPLLARARAAAAVICRGPIPPQLAAAFGRLWREFAAFRRAARR